VREVNPHKVGDDDRLNAVHVLASAFSAAVFLAAFPSSFPHEKSDQSCTVNPFGVILPSSWRYLCPKASTAITMILMNHRRTRSPRDHQPLQDHCRELGRIADRLPPITPPPTAPTPTRTSFTEITMLPTIGGNTQIFTGTFVRPAASPRPTPFMPSLRTIRPLAPLLTQPA